MDSIKFCAVQGIDTISLPHAAPVPVALNLSNSSLSDHVAFSGVALLWSCSHLISILHNGSPQNHPVIKFLPMLCGFRQEDEIH
jgi:hypothetical protein